ncbi:MAG: o-succinylbenzoate synthase [Flavobacteriales bacterium]|nr:o-succinylbenzoate synthase [Flavobacteriales bacterium]
MKVKAIPYDLDFIAPVGTSRGILESKRSWILYTELDRGLAVGECGIFAGLSSEDLPAYESVLDRSIKEFHQGTLDLKSLRAWPSILCGWEMLLSDIESKGSHELCSNSFNKGLAIPINGLIWMGSRKEMLEQIDLKLSQDFPCVKLKIGGIDFAEELDLLTYIRSHFTSNEIEIRLDANGAFEPNEAIHKLNKLAPYEIHSIEQPIRQGQWDAMAHLCANSPIPIALDEELIGLHDQNSKKKMISHISPQYIIVKPSLVGGFSGSDEWVEIAESSDIQWWATSALESNIGLNAIAQWTSTKSNPLPQGLGTGSLYSNNFPSPLKVESGTLTYDSSATWDFSSLKNV